MSSVYVLMLAVHFTLPGGMCRWPPAHARNHFTLFLRSVALEGFGLVPSIFRFGILCIETTGSVCVESLLSCLFRFAYVSVEHRHQSFAVIFIYRICSVDNLERALHYFPVGACRGALYCFFFFWHFTAYRAFARSLIGTDFQALVDSVAFLRDFASLRMTSLNVRSTLICAGDSLHTRVIISLSVAVSFAGVRCYSKPSSFWILGYLDHWLARSACRQRVSLQLLLTLLLPCMSSMAVFLGTIARASSCLHFTFLRRRRCMLWIDFCAKNKT